MTFKDDGGEVFSKKVLDWLTGITAIATVLATIFGLFVDEKNARLYAFVVAFLLAIISSGVFFYQHRRKVKLKIAEPVETLSATASLRGLLPFEEGDQLPGRGRDVQELYTLVASSSFRFGVLWGELGCGKTSLLRAGLVPKLRNEKFLPLYISRPTKNPVEALRTTLLKEVPRIGKNSDKGLNELLKLATPPGKKIIILFDQFEEFFITNRTSSSRSSFIKWLGRTVNDEKLPITFLICIRGDFFGQLQSFAPEIHEPTSTRYTIQLQNFDTEQARQIFSAAAKADAIPFEPELIQAVVSELEIEEFVRPAELQIVGTRLKRKNITRFIQYEVLGGARGILSSYINDEIKQSPNEQVARLVLRLMCENAFETKSPTDFGIKDIVQGVSGSFKPGQIRSNVEQDLIQKILDQFVTARVLIRTEDDKYNLAHDYLAPYVRAATEGTEANTERANRLLKRYVAEYREDPNARIPFGRVREIQKHASPAIKNQIIARQLIKKSMPDYYVMLVFYFLGRFVLVLTIGIPILLFLLYVFLRSSYYFSVEDSTIVILSGHPRLTFFPGFDKVIINTGFQESDLDSEFRDAIFGGEVTGFWFNQTEDGYQVWGEQLAMRLSPLSQAIALLQLGELDRATEILSEIILNSETETSVRSQAIYVLGSLAQARPDVITLDLLVSLKDIVVDPQADSDLRILAAEALRSLAQATPDAVTSDLLGALNEIVHYPRETAPYPGGIVPYPQADSRYQVADALGSLAQARPDAVTPEIIAEWSDVVLDPQADPNLRILAAHALGSLAQAKPDMVTPDLLDGLSDMVLDPQADSNLRTLAAYALGSFAQAKPDVVTPDLVNALGNMVLDPQTDSNLRYQAAEALGSLAQAKPDVVTPEQIAKWSDIVLNPQDYSDVYPYAANTLRLLTDARPDTVTSDLLVSLSKTLFDPEFSTQAAYTLAWLAQAKPDAITSDLLTSLNDATLDTQANANVRSQAAYALGALGQVRPDIISTDIVDSLINLLASKTDSHGRKVATYALFGICFGDANHESMIQRELERMQVSPEPYLRMSSFRLLEMIAIGNLAEEVLSHPEQNEMIKLRLQYLVSQDHSLVFLDEEHVSFAASITLEQVQKIEKKSR